ncbi:hypothetical protein LTR37_014101 [Vermiconidia calcicola]|uniref:Uncharacterized protein n=1 Tax=Vermiconidia calcicola TaxID=1690605 RepID=A0ACC3MVQ9_9PEZI|nr:hypothetical protein LTR37_014101 [Vermiconidia calcicola]
MDWSSPDHNRWTSKLVTRFGKKLRSNSAFTEESIRKDEARAADGRRRLVKRNGFASRSVDSGSTQQDVNELGERDYSIFSQASTLVGNKDHTDMMHRLAHHGSFDSLLDQAAVKQLKDPYFDSQDPNALALIDPLSEIHRQQFEALPSPLWKRIASFLHLTDATSLSVSTKLLYQKLGPEPLIALGEPENRQQKLAFLHRLDAEFPQHLLCFPCAKFHRRLQPGKESLKADYVANPIFVCPSTRETVLPRMRLVHGRELPYAFVQLALRSEKQSPAHGVHPESLARRWKCPQSEWTHQTRYMIHDGRLLMRVVSRAYASPSKEMTETSARHLLYDREEYTPYFSVCAHWRDGELMRVCKCALSHIPSPPRSYAQQLKQAPKVSRSAARPNFIVTGCDDCRPGRRCPECPTEYLIEVQMTEDKNDPVRPFKHAIVVTRWSDLGDGSSPYTSPEWTAIKGVQSDGKGYESLKQVGRRAVSGIFESRISGSVPGQRMLSLNPKNERYGEEGHGWY